MHTHLRLHLIHNITPYGLNKTVMGYLMLLALNGSSAIQEQFNLWIAPENKRNHTESWRKGRWLLRRGTIRDILSGVVSQFWILCSLYTIEGFFSTQSSCYFQFLLRPLVGHCNSWLQISLCKLAVWVGYKYQAAVFYSLFSNSTLILTLYVSLIISWTSSLQYLLVAQWAPRGKHFDVFGATVDQ